MRVAYLVRPRIFIAVTAPVRESDIGLPRVVLEEGYQRAVRVAGALPLILSPLLDEEALGRLFDAAGGLMLTGGEDVDPSRYGENMNGSRRVSSQRDAMEISLAEAAIERAMPILAICRGMQLLNVVLGGTLYQDLETYWGTEIDHDRYREFDAPIHTIRAERTRRLDGVVSARVFEQNSAHHQGIRDLAAGLTAVAWAPDGLVEGVEYHQSAGWTVGVQWHPERRLADGTNRRLLERFGEEVRRSAGGRVG